MKYDGTNLTEVLMDHKHWLISLGEQGSRADFSYTSLIHADLVNCCLQDADFYGANLTCANISFSSLNDADMSDTKLVEAILYGADLSGTNFKNANLSGVHVEDAFCNHTDFSTAKVPPELPICCPDEGSFIGWKKCEHQLYGHPVIVKLLIPEHAKLSSSTGRKCRCDSAIVLEIQNLKGEVLEDAIATSLYDSNFIYEVGETIVPDKPFDENRWNECSSGIHFFITRQEAVDY